MTTQTATYSKAAAGRLEIVFWAAFASSTTTDAGFPGNNGDSYIVLKCRVLDASSTQLGISYIRSSDPSAHLVFSYPGGNANWTIEISDAAHAISGLGSVSAVNPKATCILIKA